MFLISRTADAHRGTQIFVEGIGGGREKREGGKVSILLAEGSGEEKSCPTYLITFVND